MTYSNGDVVSYTYDELDRLVEIEYDDCSITEYTMYYRPLIKGAIDTVGDALKEGIVRGSIIWAS